VLFCHLVIGVTDVDGALASYRDVLGMDVVFETLISGEPFDAALHARPEQRHRRGITGIHNVSLWVVNLDDTHRRITAAGHTPDQEPFEIACVRTFFVKDPDGTPVEFIELPGGVRSTYEMHRGMPLRMGPAN
jgi:catechol 2,3-dioxygenase-like lactoylglutathione lyase family enzyme